jgi:condensin complex subunit 3
VDNLGLFLHCFSRGHEAIRVEVLHILSDIFMTHGMGILTEETVKPESIISIWTKAIRSEDEPEVAAAAAESLAKLMLASIVTDDDILKTLVETYFLPQTSQNDPLKQALSYFFPVYCHSVPENQYRMARVRVSDTCLTIDCCACDPCTAPSGGGSRGR